MARDRNASVRRRVAANIIAPPEQLASLLDDKDPVVSDAAAANPSLVPALIEQLAQEGRFLHALARNPSTPAHWLDRWGRVDQPETLQWWVAQNPSARTDFAERKARTLPPRLTSVRPGDEPGNGALLRRKSSAVELRKRLAALPRMPAWLVEELAQDEDHRVRQEMAAGGSVTAELLEKLAMDENELVRARAMRNTRLSRDVLERLALHSNAAISGDAERVLDET